MLKKQITILSILKKNTDMQFLRPQVVFALLLVIVTQPSSTVWTQLNWKAVFDCICCVNRLNFSHTYGKRWRIFIVQYTLCSVKITNGFEQISHVNGSIQRDVTLY